MTHTLHLGDCRDVLATLDDASIDAIVCDPPYELGFMGKAWDASGIAYDVTVWQQCLRVLKPGGHLIAFGGSRTYHRLAVAIEDAGFEIRDQIQWIYGSGFPKSHNLRDEWHGWGTALKPAHEPAVLARKPLRGTVADTVAQWGTGALNIEGTRVGSDAGWSYPNGRGGSGWHGKDSLATNLNIAIQSTAGRWPSNVILDEEAASLLGEPSRFFYVAKASKAEREAGLDGVELQSAGVMDGRRVGSLGAITQPRANHHPTVKPLALMRYLVRMVTPPGGVVLDPFMGSGSTGCAAVLEGFDFVGVDLTPEYVAIAQKRIDWYAVTSPLDSMATMELDIDQEPTP